jgi:hypothetical protein
MSELTLKRVRAAIICLGIVLIAVPFILSLQTRSPSRTQTPAASSDSDEVTIGDTHKTEELTPQEQRALRANLVIKSKSMRLMTEKDYQELKKRYGLPHMPFPATHVLSVTMSYRGRTPYWWGETPHMPKMSIETRDIRDNSYGYGYVLHKGRQRHITDSTATRENRYEVTAKVYRGEFTLNIPEARESADNIYSGELMLVHSGPVDHQSEKVKFTVPVPYVHEVKKTGSS